MKGRAHDRARAGASLAAVALVALLTGVLAVALAPWARRAVAAAKSDEKAVKLKKNQAWVAPDFAAYAVRAIAFAPVSSNDRNPDSEKLVRQALEPEFASLKFRFLSQSAVMDQVRRGQAEKAMEAMHAAALGGASLDTVQTHAVAAQTGADAILFSHVSQWTRFVVDANTRGQSFTQIGLEMTMYSLKDGRALWRGNFQEKGDGPYNDPSLNNALERDPGGNAMGKKGQFEPPPYAEVLEKLAERIAKAMPAPPASAPAATDAVKS